MKLLTTLLVIVCSIGLCASDEDKPSAYEKLKSETGASAEELENGIKFFTDFYIRMRDEIEAGTVDIEDLVEGAKNFRKEVKDIVAAMQRDDEMTTMMTLLYLKALDRNDIDGARESMAKRLARFVEDEDPSTENSKKLRETILEYSKTSPSLKPLIRQNEKPSAGQPAPPAAASEPDTAGQPATRLESK